MNWWNADMAGWGGVDDFAGCVNQQVERTTELSHVN